MHGIDNNSYAYSMWPVVLFNALLFVGFAISFIRPRGKTEWRTMGVFVGFIVALFTEMYGLPLTIYFLTQWLGASYPVLNPFSHAHGHLWLVWLGLADSGLAMTLLHLASNAIIFVGFYLLYKGWSLIYHNPGKLVREGIYSKIRHPQYSGLFLITVGFLLQWPTLITLIMWPVLIVAYYKLAKREEAHVESEFPGEYTGYKNEVPAFVPRFEESREQAVADPQKETEL